jgi:glutamyl/glutaminyl-tRNA synthetase
MKEVWKELKQPRPLIMQLLRYALAGMESGVGVPTIIEILGKERTIRRIEKCREWPD